MNLGFYNPETKEFKIIDFRVIRNYVVSFIFITSCIISYFIKGRFTLKDCIIIWLIIFIGWAINFILDNHKKIDDVHKEYLNMFNTIENTIKSQGIEEKTLNETFINIRNFYNDTMEKRKLFKDEIIVIAGFIGTVLGSTFFLKFISE